MLKRIVAASLAALIALPPAVATAAAPPEPAAEPFPVVALPEPPTRSHRAAWLTLAAGVGLTAGSFVLHERANTRYQEYLDSTDPTRLDDLYDRTLTLDRLSTATLIGGEVLLATGVYLRFLRGAGGSRFALRATPGGLAAAWRF